MKKTGAKGILNKIITNRIFLWCFFVFALVVVVYGGRTFRAGDILEEGALDGDVTLEMSIGADARDPGGPVRYGAGEEARWLMDYLEQRKYKTKMNFLNFGNEQRSTHYRVTVKRDGAPSLYITIMGAKAISATGPEAAREGNRRIYVTKASKFNLEELETFYNSLAATP